MWLQFAFIFLRSNFIFSEKRRKVFYFEGPLKPLEAVLNVVFFSWNNNNIAVAVDLEFQCFLQELHLQGKYEFK